MIGSSAVLTLLIIFLVVFGLGLATQLKRLIWWVVNIPGRIYRYILSLLVEREELKAAKLRAAKAAEELQNEQLRDLFKK